MMTPIENTRCKSRDDLIVLSIISLGLIAILMACVLGIFMDSGDLPDFAENVLVAIATGTTLKLGDALAALVQLATGRQVENLGNQLGQSVPTPPKKIVPESVTDAAEQVADAAASEAADIKRTE